MSQLLMTQAAEVVFEKEFELPGKFRFVKRETAGDRIHLVSFLRRLLNLRDQRDGLFLVLIALLFRLCFVNLKQLPVAEIFLHDDTGRAIDRVNLGHWKVAREE